MAALYLTDSGEEIKAFNSQDGHGLKMLKASGVGHRAHNRQAIALRRSEGQGLGRDHRLPGREEQAARV